MHLSPDGDGAAADVAATLIANAVDIESPSVSRRPACTMQEDSDLGDLPVVVAVGALSEDDIVTALAEGLAEAQRMRAAGLIVGAFLALRGRYRTLGMPGVASPEIGAVQARAAG